MVIKVEVNPVAPVKLTDGTTVEVNSINEILVIQDGAFEPIDRWSEYRNAISYLIYVPIIVPEEDGS